jgi:hypothetical protein
VTLTLAALLALAAPLGAQESPPEMPGAPAPAAPQATPTADSAPAAPAVPGTTRNGRLRDRVHVLGGSRTIAADETVADAVVVGGDLRVEGTVRGDAVVVGGNLILAEGGTVRGDAVVTGGEIIDEGGRVLGEMQTVDNVAGLGASAKAKVSAERAAERAAQVKHSRSGGWFRPIVKGLSYIIRVLAFAIVLGGIGGALIFYGRGYLETVSDTIRSSTLRAGAVGLAATFLVIPAFVVLVVALAVSIVGIPLLLVAVPLYPLAVAAAAVFGLLAAMHALGERTAEQQRERFDLRYTNSYGYLFSGLFMLLAPLVAAGLIQMTGFLGFIAGLLKFVVTIALWAAMTIGLGAVLLPRAGTRRTFAAERPFAEPDTKDFDTKDFDAELDL